MTADEWWLVVCRAHGLVADAIEHELVAQLRADAHERQGCELRVLTEDEWAEARIANQADEPDRDRPSNRAFTGP